jgi:hypothetical protein
MYNKNIDKYLTPVIIIIFYTILIGNKLLFNKKNKYDQSLSERIIRFFGLHKNKNLSFIDICIKYNRYYNVSNDTKILIEKIYSGEFDNEKYEEDVNFNDNYVCFFGNYHFDVTKNYKLMFMFYLIGIKKNNKQAMIELASYYDTVFKNNDEKIKYLLRANATILLGIHYYGTKQYDEMFRYFDMAKTDYLKMKSNFITRFFHNPSQIGTVNESHIFLYLGKYYYHINDTEKMLENYEIAIKMKNCNANYDIACYYQKIKNYDEMKKNLLLGIQKYNNSNAMYGLAIYYKTIKNYKKMDEYFIMSIKFNNKLGLTGLNKFYNNNLKVYILLDTVTNNIFIEEQKNILLTDPKIKYYLTNKDNNSEECYICFEKNIKIKLKCGHKICYECFYRLDKCPLRCNKFI